MELMNILSIMGFGMIFISGLVLAIIKIIESHRDVKGRVAELYSKQQERYKNKRNLDILLLILFVEGAIFQIIGFLPS